MTTSIIYITMMTVIGFLVFDSISVAVAFGIGVGLIFGTVFSSSKEEE